MKTKGGEVAVRSRVEDQALVFLARAEPWLEKLNKAPPLKKLRDEAETIKAHLRRVRSARPSVNRVARFKVMAEHRLGEIWPDTKRGRPKKGTQENADDRQLSDHRLPSRWKRMASVPLPRVKEILDELDADPKGWITSTAVLDEAAAIEKRKRIAKATAAGCGEPVGKVNTLEEAHGRYQTVYLDPPWAYDDSKVNGGVDHEYETMDLGAVEAMPVRKLMPKDGGHVWMWTTWPMIREGAVHRLFSAWGLTWKGEIVWDKDKLLLGRWIRVQTEVLILGVAGKVQRLAEDVRGLHREKSGRHSAKPAAFYALIERFSPGPRIELFARAARRDWDRWGLEA